KAGNTVPFEGVHVILERIVGPGSGGRDDSAADAFPAGTDAEATSPAIPTIIPMLDLLHGAEDLAVDGVVGGYTIEFDPLRESVVGEPPGPVGVLEQDGPEVDLEVLDVPVLLVADHLVPPGDPVVRNVGVTGLDPVE